MAISGHLQAKTAKTTQNLFIFLTSGFNNYRYRALMGKVFVVELGAWSFNMGSDYMRHGRTWGLTVSSNFLR